MLHSSQRQHHAPYTSGKGLAHGNPVKPQCKAPSDSTGLGLSPSYLLCGSQITIFVSSALILLKTSLYFFRVLLSCCASCLGQYQNLTNASRGKLCQSSFSCLTFSLGLKPLKSWLPLHPQTAVLCLSRLIELQEYYFLKKLFVVLCLVLASLLPKG